MSEIGGSMGPLYGTFFTAMAKEGKDAEVIDAEVFERMLDRAVAGVAEVGGAKVGDKTLMDALVPALESYRKALVEGAEFEAALEHMAEAAERGKEATRELVAKVGRSARLGERSRGVLDAGAASCALLLRAMADSAAGLLQ
jgi:dihydroxyacetone kinase-like protein